MADKVRFTVLEGGRDKQTTVNNVSLVMVPNSLSPLPVDVRVFEEDTYLVLTVDPIIRYTEEHPIRMMTRVMETQPKRPGSIITNNASWYAVVHDLDAEPTCCQEWIEQAYRATLTLAEQKRIQKIGLPLLGTVHGKFPPDESIHLLINVIKAISFQHLKKILILAPRKDYKSIWKHLQELP